jgi:hypothetical protein
VTLGSSRGAITMANPPASQSTASTSSYSGVNTIDISDIAGASRALGILDDAMTQVNSTRAGMGALVNRFEAVISSQSNSILNVSASRSRILDADYAKEKRFSIKLVANAQKLKNGKLAAFVLPQFVSANDDLYHVQNEFNAVTTESTFADKHFFKGKGAGAFPTASAVLSDISALRYNYKYEYKKIYHQTDSTLTNDFYLKVFISVDNLNKINKDHFEWIEDLHNGLQYSWMVGSIHSEKLFNSSSEKRISKNRTRFNSKRNNGFCLVNFIAFKCM